MLILARRTQQTIVIDGPARIVVMEIDRYRDRVKIGIDAPASTHVTRGELLERDAEAER